MRSFSARPYPVVTSTDGDLLGDVCDTDDDNDGVDDLDDLDQLDPTVCADVDADGCDDCQCGVWGDMDGGSDINPVDVAYLVNFVYKQLDALVDPPDCSFSTGDVNCDDGVDPLDVTYLVNYVYLSLDALCDGCSE